MRRPTIESESQEWRRACGCVRTSDKLKEIMLRFPVPPPPTPSRAFPVHYGLSRDRLLAELKPVVHDYPIHTDTRYSEFCYSDLKPLQEAKDAKEVETPVASRRTWELFSEMVWLVQLSVVATALAVYYLVYCYMQLVYYTLRTAVYFHQADLPMKVTIAVVTVTSLVIFMHMFTRMEKMLKII